MQGIEKRVFTLDSLKVERRGKAGELRIVGHAAVFNTAVDIGGWFREQVAPGAFRRAIAEDDVRSLFNHDPNYILGRSKAGTLKLSEDDTGLHTITIPPDTSYARDLMVSLERGDVNQMSFGFRVRKEQWDEGSADLPLRTLLEVELFDVSPVTFPAYPTTDVGLRDMARTGLESLEVFRKARQPEAVSAAAAIRRAMKARATIAA